MWVLLLLLPFLGESEQLKPEDEQDDDLTLIFIISGLGIEDVESDFLRDELLSVFLDDSSSPSKLFSSVDFLFNFLCTITSSVLSIFSCFSFITFAVRFVFV